MKIHTILAIFLLMVLLSGCALPEASTQPLPASDSSSAVSMAETTRVDAATLAGRWEGTLVVAGTDLTIVVAFTEEDGAFVGAIDIPQQNAVGIPLHDIAVDVSNVYFEILAGPQLAVFSGKLAEDTLSGVFTQAGAEGTFELSRVDATTNTSAENGNDADIYAEPSGRFTVPIPTNWTVDDSNGYTTLSSPGGLIRVNLLVLPGEEIKPAVDTAWALVDPSFDLAVDEETEEPNQNVEQAITYTYDTPDDSVVLANGQLLDGHVYVRLVRGDGDEIQRRLAQVRIVAAGFTLTAVQEVDLTDVQPVPLTAERLIEFEDYIVEQMAQLRVPGAAVAVVSGDEIVYMKGFGTRSPDSDEPITPQTHMMIGSTGKTLTTMLMASLVDDDLLAWDKPVLEILPQFAVADPDLTQQITVKNLVCACTGVPRRDVELVFNATDQHAEEVIEGLAGYEFFTDFGEAFQYSNQMVATGGYVAAAAAGGEWGNLSDAYAQVLMERITSPIGMKNTTLSFDEVVASDNYAIPHGLNLNAEYYSLDMDVEKLLLPVAPAGAHWSTLEDMAAYLSTHMNAGVAPTGQRIVSVENLSKTWEPQVQMTANSSYGLGWVVGEYKGVRMLRHNGNTFGFSSELAFLPDAGVGIVVLTNARATNLFNEAIRFRLLEKVYDQPYEIEEQVQFAWAQTLKQAQDQAKKLGESVALDVVGPYLGEWRNEALGSIILHMDGEALLLDTGDFTSTVRPFTTEGAEAGHHVLFEMPLAGLSVRFESADNGVQQIVLGSGVSEYIFTRTD